MYMQRRHFQQGWRREINVTTCNISLLFLCTSYYSHRDCLVLKINTVPKCFHATRNCFTQESMFMQTSVHFFAQKYDVISQLRHSYSNNPFVWCGSNITCPPRWRRGSELDFGSEDPGSIPCLPSPRVGPLMAKEVKGTLKTPSCPWRGCPAAGQNLETGHLSRHYIAEISLNVTLNHNQQQHQILPRRQATASRAAKVQRCKPWHIV